MPFRRFALALTEYRRNRSRTTPQEQRPIYTN